MGTIKTEQSLDSELYLNSSCEKATGCLSTGWQVLVEMLRQKLCNPLSFKGFRMHHVNSSNFPQIYLSVVKQRL